MFLTTPRLLLRPPWPEDAAALHVAVAHWDVARFTARLPWPYTLDDARAYIAAARADRRRADFLVTARGDGAILGGSGWSAPDDPAGDPDLGYWLTPAAWGRGYATEAAAAVAAFAMDTMRLPRLAAGHYFDNPASGTILQRIGFVATGETLAWPCRARGRPVESVEYELTRAQWLAHRAARPT